MDTADGEKIVAAAPAPSEPAAGGYEGWWNAPPASGSAMGLPKETVAINTRTNTVVDAFSRNINDAGGPTRIVEVPYTVVPDPSWPAESVVIIDTATNTIIENFRVDLKGNPLRWRRVLRPAQCRCSDTRLPS